MRDLLEDFEAGRLLSSPDPMKRAQNSMRTPLPKRFYEKAEVEERDGAFAISLDGKPVRTPGRTALGLPTRAAAALVAAEFEAQREIIDPMTMPVLRLVNTAIDGVAAEMDAVLEDVLRFSASDMILYRADGPDELVRLEAEVWDPWLDWARNTLGARFYLAEGVMHVEQPREAVNAVATHLRRLAEPMRLAAVHLMTTLTGSAILALAVEAGDLDPEQAWRAAHVDEDFNIAQWGEDAEATLRRANRRRDFDAAVNLVKAL